jgi:hypothetical protein
MRVAQQEPKNGRRYHGGKLALASLAGEKPRKLKIL